MVQRRAAWWTLSDYTRMNSVTSLQSQLNWQTLQGRRSVTGLCLFYKFVNGLVAVLLPDYMKPTHRISGYCHSMTFHQIHTSKDYYKNSFPLAIVQSNALQTNVQLRQVFRSSRQIWPFIFTLTHYNSFIFYSFSFTWFRCLPKKSRGLRHYHKIGCLASELSVEKWTNIHDWDQNIIYPFCQQHACPFGLKVYTTSTQSHRSRHKCVQHLCQNKCLLYQNWHFECSYNFPSANNGYEW